MPSVSKNAEMKKPSKRKAADSGNILASEQTNTNITIVIEDSEPAAVEAKKRGRKPKGGKLITKDAVDQMFDIPPANVILHLKCLLKDIGEYDAINMTKIKNPLDYDASVPPSIMAYDSVDTNSRFARFLQEGQPEINDKIAYSESHLGGASNFLNTNAPVLCSKCNNQSECEPAVDERANMDSDVRIKDVNEKLKRLKVNLYRNTMDEKQSACFWCTYDFDNPACYIPKYSNDDKIFGYGSFCRPECAVGYLMKEQLDDSTKFERYHLLNRVYGKAYNYKNNIKPAPDPHYMLDKFYGNLSIQEYRKLLNSERMLLVIDSPLTRILPELHEDTDDFVAGVYGGNKGSATQAGGVYKVKRQSEKQPTASKATIMKERFGFSA